MKKKYIIATFIFSTYLYIADTTATWFFTNEIISPNIFRIYFSFGFIPTCILGIWLGYTLMGWCLE